MTVADHWLPRRVALAVAVAAALAAAAHVYVAETTLGDLTLAGGVWLALARDLAHGVFYRDLIGPNGFGGTRYFPLFFTLIAAVMKLGLSTISAGIVVAAISAVVLVFGLVRLGASIGLPRHVVWLVAAGGLVNYFTLQTLFEIRADVLAAACDVWGLALVAVAIRQRGVSRNAVAAAAFWFTLAFATKVTSLAVPAAAVVALVAARRRPLALAIGVAVAVGAAAVVGVTALLSDGRAIASWRACLLAGESGQGMLAALVSRQFYEKVAFSNFLISLSAANVAALAALGLSLLGRDRPHPEPAAGAERAIAQTVLVVFLFVTASTAAILTSPGTTAFNQAVEWVSLSYVLIALGARARPAWRLVMSAALALLVAYAGLRNLPMAWDLHRATTPAESREQRARIAAIAQDSPGPVLYESPLLAVVADQPAFVIDPFALRVVMATRPDVRAAFLAKVDAHAFSKIVLQYDPTNETGSRHYHTISFGWPIVERILANYRFDGDVAAHAKVYVPRSGR